MSLGKDVVVLVLLYRLIYVVIIEMLRLRVFIKTEESKK